MEHKVILNWDEVTTADVDFFDVHRSDTSGGPYTVIGEVPANQKEYTDNVNLVEGKTYFYVITAKGDGGESALSAEVSAKVPFLAPDAPTNVVVKEVD